MQRRFAVCGGMAAETSAPISRRLALWGGGGFAKEQLG